MAAQPALDGGCWTSPSGVSLQVRQVPCSGIQSRVAFGGGGRSALKLSGGVSWKFGQSQQTAGLPMLWPREE